jgi:biotin carboxyl carrier protein
VSDKQKRTVGNTDPAISELLERLNDSAADPARLLADQLAVQSILLSADDAAVVRFADQSQFHILAVYPDRGKLTALPQWLAASMDIIRQNTATPEPVIRSLPQHGDFQLNGRSIILHADDIEGLGRAMSVFLIDTPDDAQLAVLAGKVELSAALCRSSVTARSSTRIRSNMERVGMATETLAAVNTEKRIKGMSMALCNEVAARWKCERVALGFLKGRYVQLKALSHTEHFSRKMEIIQDIEAAMEECLDQDIEVVFPAGDDATFVCRAAETLSRQHGPLNVLSLPLRQDAEVRAVLTLLRPLDNPFTIDEIEAIRLACQLCSPTVIKTGDTDRWFGARFASATREVLSHVLGPRHTWAKLTAVVIFAALIFLIFAKGQFKAQASCVLEAVYQQVIPAPFDGYLKTVEVEVDDQVQAGVTVLATLDTAELRLQLAAAQAERAGYLKQAAAAMRDGNTSSSQIAQASADQGQARIDLLAYQISQADIISPLTGRVVQGDLKRQIGAPVKIGDILFEVMPLDAMRAQLLIPEDEIFDVTTGQEGYLATYSYPSRRIHFRVEKIEPLAEVVNQRNVFRVRVQLSETPSWLRPGMEGVAKVHVAKRPYIWIWTRKIVNWIRMKLWI